MQKIVVGISGASGGIYGIQLLKAFKQYDVETHLVISNSGKVSLSLETEFALEDIKNLATYYYDNADISAKIASGSFLNSGMIIAPCSMNTLGSLAAGITPNLLTRSADVCLKERRKLLLLTRETPLHSIHLDNMLKLSKVGVIIFPPMVATYHKPRSVMDVINHSVAKVLDMFDIKNDLINRWRD